MFGFADSELVLYVAYGLIGLGVFSLVRTLLQEQEARAAQENMQEEGGSKSRNFLVKATRPLFTQYIMPITRGRTYWDDARRTFRRKLIASGLKDELNAEEVIAFRIALVVVFPTIGIVLKQADFLPVNWFTIIASAALGWFYPVLWMNSRISARQKSILKAMPFIIDLLALSTEAGLDFVGAIGKVVEKAAQSPLVEEFGQLLKEIKVGASRQDALREMAVRIDMSQLNSFVAILISADQMGASIGKVLRQQSEAMRTERMVRAEKAGAAASQKVLIPLVLFIVPAVMVMIFGPFILSMVYGGGGALLNGG